MTSEQFRTTLELLVNRSDPRNDYCELAKIGEGSTGVVYLAKEIATGRKVAVKKMNIRRQQRRELLFNEVRKKIFTTNVVRFYILSFYPWLMTTTECSTQCNYMVHWGLFM
jgi:serine/threonine protein kinase